MDVTYLKELGAELVTVMQKQGYRATYINRHRTVISQIIANSEGNAWQSYADVFDWYKDSYQSETYLHEIHAILRNIECFHSKNELPGKRAVKSSLSNSTSSYEELENDFRSLIDFYSNVMKGRQVRPATLYSAKHKSAAFLLDLQKQGQTRLENVTEEGVLNCFFKDGKRIRGASCAGIIRDCLRSSTKYSPECERIVSYVPVFRHDRKNIQYLTADEVSALRKAIDDTGNSLSFKDRAIGMLLLYTGIRGCDIALMTLDSIDWKNDVIRFAQSKTLQVVEIPLSPIVGNAIYDYCVNERPRNDNRIVFLSDFAPHCGMTPDGIGVAVGRMMAAAGIRQNKGDRRGTHIFRHRVVTSLLDNEITAPVISSTLGHSSPVSLEAYLNADIGHLRTCALPIEKFNVAKEVF